MSYIVSLLKLCAYFMGFQKLYKQDWDEKKATGYQLNHEYIPLLTSKKGREIISDVSVLRFFIVVCHMESYFHLTICNTKLRLSFSRILLGQV